MFQPGWFGKYYLYERIAVGGMAEIFRAKLYGVDGFEKDMVVKQILPQYADNKEFIQMFVDEAKISVNLTHGNIVPVFELGQVDGMYFISMECVNGVTLGELLDAGLEHEKPISLPHCLFVACKLLAGLDYAHRKTDEKGQYLHIVHRDVSPQNILISFEGDVKIVDFGIAQAATKVHNTEIGMIKGKLGYMSPEQAIGKEIDARTDIFSTGIILYEMLTMKRMFECNTEHSFLERLKRADITTPSSINTDLPVQLDGVVFKALEQKPSSRYQSADEMRLVLLRILYQLPQEASSKTFSAYVKDLFANKLSQRREIEQDFVPAPNPKSISKSPNIGTESSKPEDLFQDAIMKDGLQINQKVDLQGADNISLFSEALDTGKDYSFLKSGRRLKKLVLLVALLIAVVLIWVSHEEIGKVISTVDEVMDESTARLAQKKLGSLIVQSNPSGAVVYFDGRKVGVTNVRIGNIDPSREYELILTLRGYQPWSRSVLPSDWQDGDKMVLRIYRDWDSESLK